MRRLEWDAAHRVMRHESKCSTLHGHRYVAEMCIEAVELDSVGRVMDFGEIKAVLGKFIDDNLDHTTIVNIKDQFLVEYCQIEERQNGKRAPYIMDDEPTAENIARHLFEKFGSMVDNHEVKIQSVKVWETPNCWAKYPSCS